MDEPNSEQVETAASALVPFVRRWSLPLNPEDLQLMAYVVLRHALGQRAEQEIASDVEKLIDDDAADHERMRHAMRASRLELVAVVVEDYDEAIDFFVNKLSFVLVEDSPAVTNDGRPKRWVVVRPRGGGTGLLLARADGARQQAIVGEQFAGRVGFFLEVEDFDAEYERLVAAGVTFAGPPRNEAYGKVAVFLDVAGNRWDLRSRLSSAAAPPLGH